VGSAKHKELEDLLRRIDVPEGESESSEQLPEPIPISSQPVREWRVWGGGASQQPISLFTDRPPSRQRPVSFIFSFLVHSAVICLVAFGVLYGPRIRLNPLGPHILVRQVNLDEPDSQMQRSSGSGAYYPDEQLKQAQNAAASAVKAEMASARPKLPVRHPAPQTIVQPDINVDKLIQQKIPMPAMLLWSANRPKVRTITPPKPQQLNASSVIPKVDRPNPSQNLKDISITDSAFKSNLPMPETSTTTPLVLPGPRDVEKISETSSVQLAQASAANVASISDLAMKQGVVALPPVNQIAAGNGGIGTSGKNGSGQHGEKEGNAGNGTRGNANGHAGSSSGAGGGNSGGKGASNGHGTGSTNGNNPVESAGNGAGFEQGPAPTPISRPKDGQFGVVVVGNSVAQDFPQTARFWSDRIVYTVFLHVGLPKTWILQYSEPREEDASATGNKHILAPWPYYILRPNIDPDEVNADAMIVHGFISEKGKFENLQVVFPNVSMVGRADTLLKQIAQWQFKPATDNGKPTRVETLLIIPQGD
jgi:hypothetical protein